MKRLLVLWMLLAVLPAAAAEYMTNRAGQSYRVEFDHEGIIRFGWERDFLLECNRFSFGYRFTTTARDVDGQRWRHRYNLLSTEITDHKANRADFPVMKAVIFSQESMYYLAKPYITLPTRPPRQVRVPFNFGVTYLIGGFEVPETAGVPRYDLEIISGRVVLDWIPSADYSTLLQIHFGVVSRELFYEKDGGEKSAFILAPFTAFGARLRLESKAGRRTFDIRWDCIPAWSSETGWGTDIEASALFRMILVAINDQPLFLRISSTYRHRGITRLAGGNDVEWTLGAGIGLSFQMP